MSRESESCTPTPLALVEQLTRLTIAVENLNAIIANEGKRGGVVDRLAMSLVGVRDAINRSANFR